MKAILRFFLSLKTVFGLFLVCAVLAVYGSLKLPYNLAFFSGIDDTPLFIWLSEAGNLRHTWWIYGFVLASSLLAASTIICTVDAILNKSTWSNKILKLSPQIMHLGVLFVMFGHLLTAWMGLKTDLRLEKGETKTLYGNVMASLDNVQTTTDRAGYSTDWKVEVSIHENSAEKSRAVIKPLHPFRIGNVDMYFKSATAGENPSALIRVCRDPGAGWALAGGILVLIGGIGFIYGRFRN